MKKKNSPSSQHHQTLLTQTMFGSVSRSLGINTCRVAPSRAFHYLRKRM